MLVGRSHECDYPPSIRDRPVLTGAKNPFVSCEQMNAAVTATLGTGEGLYYINADLLKQLKPDVIVTQSLCNVCSVDLCLVEQVVQEMAAAPDTPGSGPAVIPKIISLNPFNIEVGPWAVWGRPCERHSSVIKPLLVVLTPPSKGKGTKTIPPAALRPAVHRCRMCCMTR